MKSPNQQLANIAANTHRIYELAGGLARANGKTAKSAISVQEKNELITLAEENAVALLSLLEVLDRITTLERNTISEGTAV